MGATTDRIAEKAGVSVGSLDQYFPDKHALMHELDLRHIDQAEAVFAEGRPITCSRWPQRSS